MGRDQTVGPIGLEFGHLPGALTVNRFVIGPINAYYSCHDTKGMKVNMRFLSW